MMPVRKAADLSHAVSMAATWHRSLGNETMRGPLCVFVRAPERPDVWSANHASAVTASTPREIDGVLAEMDAHFPHCRHRLIFTDHFTPAPFIARLAFEDYEELTPTLQMVLTGSLEPITGPAAMNISPVASEGDWADLLALVRLDHQEGARTHHAHMADEVTAGIVEGYRRQAGPCQFFIARMEDRACAYGAAIICPNGLGMVEDLFTLPAHRGRGIASALIAHCVAHVRARGADAVFLGAHITERPKKLYAKLGFAPLFLTRQFIRHN